MVLEFVRGEVARILGARSASLVDPHKGLFEMGMDSLMSVELKSRLERAVQSPLPSTLTFNYPNPMSIATFLAGVLSLGDDDDGAEPASGNGQGEPDLSEDQLASMLAARLEAIR